MGADIPSVARDWDESSADSIWGEWLPVRSEFASAAYNTAAGNHAFAPYFMSNIYSDRDPFYWFVKPAVVQNLDGSIRQMANTHSPCSNKNFEIRSRSPRVLIVPYLVRTSKSGARGWVFPHMGKERSGHRLFRRPSLDPQKSVVV